MPIAHPVTTDIRRCLALSLLLLPAALGAQGVANPLRDAVQRSGGRVIVTLRSTSGDAAIRAPGAPPVTEFELAAISDRLDSQFQLRERSHAAAFGMVMGDVTPDQAVLLAADPNVAAIEADRLWAPAELTDGFDASDRWAAYRRPARADEIPYGVTQVTAPTVWAGGNRGEGVKVAVMDSGGDASHPDLAYVGGYDAVARTTTGWADDIAACTGHGTHIAGTIAARDDGNGVVGVAPRVQLYAIKVFENVSGSCLAYTSSELNGLNWAVSQGIRLVNVSLGGSYSFALDVAINSAAASGTFMIAAAGNSGGAVLYPGSSQYAIGVAAVDGSNTRASWSSFGPEVDFSAPGVGINSTMPGGGYGVKSGTSMATPHVVGVAALILAASPSLTFAQLYQKLRDGALDLESGGFDNNTGYGLVRAANSIGGAPPPPIPLALSVSPAARSVSVVQGAAAPSDQATVSITGDNNSTAPWSATKRKAWTTLTTGSGTGSGTLVWSRSATGLAVGTYVDTLTVTATGVATPRVVYDTLRITAAPIPLALNVSPAARSVSVAQGATAAGDQATVTITGDNNSTAPWSATKRKAWTTLTTGSGTGSGTLVWSRNATGLAVGTYVDTLTVTATGVATPRVVYDTLRITSAPIPLALSVSPAARSVTVVQGAAAPSDQATVSITGDNNSTAPWSATKRKAWTTLTTGSGTGSGTLAWSRNATGLAVGTYVDTLTVTPTGFATSRVVYDTLRITAAPIALALNVSPAGRSVTVVQGAAAPSDQATVSITGDNNSTASWSATKRKAWTTLTTGSGTGSGTLVWSRNATGLAAGTYVDTITVTATGVAAPSVVFDTLRITAAPIALALSVSPAARSVTVAQGATAAGDQATVTITGDNSSATPWSATKRKAWTTLTTANGTGNGTLAWSRNATGLAVGTYVDTITVTATGVASPSVVFDTLRITAAPTALALNVSPGARSVTVVQGAIAAGDQATVTITGDNSSTAPWSATKRKAWITLTTSSGTGSGTLAWNRNAAGLAVGTYVDTLTVTATGVATPRVVYDTLRVLAAPVPIVVAVSPAARSVTVAQGTTAAGDQATVTITGDNNSTTPWSATARKAWTTLTNGSGIGSGTLTWSRNTTGLAVGTYVDTIRVTAGGATAQLIDTISVAAPPTTIAFKPKGKRSRVLTAAGSPTDVATTADSALVEGDVAPGASALWTATTASSRLHLVTQSGQLNHHVVWDRLAVAYAPGIYVDSITVTLQGVPNEKAVFTDTLEVVGVQLPLPGVAVDELFRGGQLNDDQRTLFDRDGNRNGYYDLGDLLAWVDRGHLRLSAATLSRLRELMVAEPASSRAKGGGDPIR